MINYILLIAALMSVESKNNPSALGDYSPLPIGSKLTQAEAIKQGLIHPLAIGCLQIHECVIIDVNRIYHTNYTWPESAQDSEKSKEICVKYLSIYCTEKRLGHVPTYEDCARCWNCGPSFAKQSKLHLTDKYWNRVKLQLDKQKTN